MKASETGLKYRTGLERVTELFGDTHSTAGTVHAVEGAVVHSCEAGSSDIRSGFGLTDVQVNDALERD